MATQTPEATQETPETQTAPETEVQETAPEAEVKTAPETNKTAFDPNAIPQEVKDHFSKQYDGHDRFKQMAGEYERLLRAPEFRSWYDGLRTPKQPQFEVSDDQFVSALSDKKQFSNLVMQLAEQVASTKLAPRIEQTQREVEFSKRTTQLKETVSRYPDFVELDKKGLIEPELAKYPGLSFEDAYWLAKRHTINEEADRKARGIVQGKKAATVEKPGNAPGGRSNTVKVKDREEAMLIAAERFRAGQEIPDFDFE